ncbi:hypothetical protein BT93_G0222 [Corymbia citriodora subsp. variegata]|nr:hypothetical protein BT93_G0222 [Corymbia citriodora subsp. variegata]
MNLELARTKTTVSQYNRVKDLGVRLMWIIYLQAQDFRQQATRMRRKMWLPNKKMKLIVLGMVAALILIIVLSICGGFRCWGN